MLCAPVVDALRLLIVASCIFVMHNECFYSADIINPYLTNGFSYHYQSGESTFSFRGIRSDLKICIQFFDEIPLSKQNSPRWDAAFCGVTSGAILFAYVT